MQVAVGAGDLHLGVAEAAQAGGDAGNVVGDDARVTDQDHIGREQLFILHEEILQVVTADFLFPFDDELQVDRLLARLHHGLQRLDVHEHLALVITGTPGKNGPFRMQLRLADDRLECRRGPQVERVRRLHIVVAIDQDRGEGGVDHALAINHRISRGAHHVHAVCTGFAQVIGHGFRAANHIVLVGGISTDGGNAKEVKELLEEAVLVGGEEILCGHACKVASRIRLGNASSSGGAKTSGANHFGSAPPGFKCIDVRLSLGCKDDVAALVGEFDPDQAGTVRQGGDEFHVAVHRFLHGPVGGGLAGCRAIGQQHQGVHGDGPVDRIGQFHLDIDIGGGGHGVRTGGEGEEGEGNCEEGGNILIHGVEILRVCCCSLTEQTWRGDRPGKVTPYSAGHDNRQRVGLLPQSVPCTVAGGILRLLWK